MRLSDLTGKEVINMVDGSRLGIIDECDLIIGRSGQILSLLLPKRSRLLQFLDRHYSTIPWRAIRRIGDELIIVDTEGAMDYSV